MTQRSLRKSIELTFLVLCATSIPTAETIAQDSHYWNLSYGTRSILLGGAVIGSVEDLAATYYNPGALGLVDDPDFILSARVAGYESLKLETEETPSRTASSSSFGLVPNLFAGIIPLGPDSKTQLAYSSLVRQRMDRKLIGRVRDVSDVIGDIPGDEVLAGETGFWQDLKELWFGVTWSRQLDEHTGVGVSSYLAYRGQTVRSQTIAQALTESGDIAALNYISEHSYWNYRLLWKAGLLLDYSPLKIGFTVTTPSVRLFGKGSSFFNVMVTGIDIDGDDRLDQRILNDFQKDQKARYHSSWAVGTGLSYEIDDITIHFCGEWYNNVDRFDVIDTRNFIDPTTGDTLRNAVVHEMRDLVNIGGGVELPIFEWMEGFGSFVTDISAVGPETRSNISVSRWNIYHATGGALFTIQDVQLMGGITYSFGRRTLTWPLSLISPDEDIIDRPDNVRFSYDSVRFLFGFSFQL